MGRGYVGPRGRPHRPDVRRHPGSGGPRRPVGTPYADPRGRGGRPAGHPEARAAPALRLVQGARRLPQRAVRPGAAGGRWSPRPVGTTDWPSPTSATGSASPTRIFVPETAPGGQGRRDRGAGGRGATAWARPTPRRSSPAARRPSSPVRWPCTPTTRSAPSPARPRSASRSDSRCPTSTRCSSPSGGGGLCSGVTRGPGRVAPGGAGGGGRARRRCPTLHRALAAGAPVDVQVGGVAADALGASRLGEIAFATVPEHDTTSLLVERRRRSSRRGAGCGARPGSPRSRPAPTALAAVLTGRYVPADGERVCVVVCGGNADPSGL